MIFHSKRIDYDQTSYVFKIYKVSDSDKLNI